MAYHAKYTKQPIEVQDYPFDFREYLQAANDTADSYAVTAAEGVTVESSSIDRGVVRAFISGGVSGKAYKLSATVTTKGGRVKQLDIQLKVKEI